MAGRFQEILLGLLGLLGLEPWFRERHVAKRCEEVSCSGLTLGREQGAVEVVLLIYGGRVEAGEGVDVCRLWKEEGIGG